MNAAWYSAPSDPETYPDGAEDDQQREEEQYVAEVGGEEVRVGWRVAGVRWGSG